MGEGRMGESLTLFRVASVGDADDRKGSCPGEPQEKKGSATLKLHKRIRFKEEVISTITGKNMGNRKRSQAFSNALRGSELEREN